MLLQAANIRMENRTGEVLDASHAALVEAQSHVRALKALQQEVDEGRDTVECALDAVQGHVDNLEEARPSPLVPSGTLLYGEKGY